MRTKPVIKYLAAAALIMMVMMSLSGFAQENITKVEDSAFKAHMRPAVPFLHDKHNEKAKLDECNLCHHVYENGKKSATSSSEGSKCSECHEVKNGQIMPLVDKYHTLCKGCHMERKAGPIMCAECHTNK